MDVFGFAKFPFISASQKYVESLDFPLSELFSERAFEQVRMRGKERVLEAIGKRIERPVISDRVSAEKELLSYPVARIIVSCINDRQLIRRYALAEAEYAHGFAKDLPADSMKDLAGDFNIEAESADGSFRLFFTDFIRYASAIHEHKWKLINRKMYRGYVQLTREEFSRLIQEATKKRIESSLPLEVPPEICVGLEGYLGEIRNSLTALKSEFSIEEFKEIMPDCFPPCIAYALSHAREGMNLSHSMRFALTSFLLNIGMNADGIVELFKVSPDFDEERTRYQVMHIQGSSGTTYKSPSCATMLTYGNCFGKEQMCERISHPLGYYSRKAWILKKGTDVKKIEKP
jgi:DNA primase large subunit